MPDDRSITYLPLDELIPAERNPKRHDAAALAGSVNRFGFVTPGLRDDRTGRLVAGHGRAMVLRSMRDSGDTPPQGVRVDSDGRWLVPVITGWASRSDAEAEAYLIADNRHAELGGWDTGELSVLIKELQGSDPELADVTGFDYEALASLLVEADTVASNAEREKAKTDAAKPNPRILPIDAIFTFEELAHPAAFFADRCGLKIGTRSSSTYATRNRERWEWKFPLTFVDNEWRDYDHGHHLNFVSTFRPKYTTVRDVMTRDQCRDAGVPYYTLEQILTWADQLTAASQNVIVIPKFDCLADIPDKFMLGYSVPSSYGQTPVPAEKFSGRRVHLLGGSWAVQRRYLALLAESVVSLDFNHCNNIARWGRFTMPDGSDRGLGADHDLWPSNGGMVALALSLGNIGRAIFDLTGGQSGAPSQLDDAPPEGADECPTR